MKTCTGCGNPGTIEDKYGYWWCGECYKTLNERVAEILGSRTLKRGFGRGNHA